MPVNKFGVDDYGKGQDEKSDIEENRIMRIVQNIMRNRQPYVMSLSSSSNLEFDAQEKRIVRVAEPISENDAVNKNYIDNVIGSLRFLMVLLLRSELINGYHVIDPYDSIEYDFPFDCFITMTKCDFGPGTVRIELEDKDISNKIFNNHPCKVKKSGKLRFKKINDIKSPNVSFLELSVVEERRKEKDQSMQ